MSTYKQFMESLGVKPLCSDEDYLEWSGCHHKVSHSTIEKAHSAIKTMHNDQLVAYQCQFCGGYHIGHYQSIAVEERKRSDYGKRSR